MARSGRVLTRFVFGVVALVAALGGPILLVIAVDAIGSSAGASPRPSGVTLAVAQTVGVVLGAMIVGRMAVALGWSRLKGLWVAVPVFGLIVSLDIIDRWAKATEPARTQQPA